MAMARGALALLLAAAVAAKAEGGTCARAPAPPAVAEAIGAEETCVASSMDARGMPVVDVHYAASADALDVAVVFPKEDAPSWRAIAFPKTAATCAPDCPMYPADALVHDASTNQVLPGELHSYGTNPVRVLLDWAVNDTGFTTALNDTHDLLWARLDLEAVPFLAAAAKDLGETGGATLGITWAFGNGDAFSGGIAAYHGSNRGTVALAWPTERGTIANDVRPSSSAMASNGTASASALQTTPAGASVGCAVGLTSTIADEVPDLASASPAPLCAVDAPQGVRVHYGTSSDAVTLAVVYDASSGMGWHAVAFPANAATCALSRVALHGGPQRVARTPCRPSV